MNNFISIITLNYNGKGYLKNFLDSALALNYPKDSYEVVVVDNASTDGSVNYLRKNYPNIKILKSEKNLGFGGGNNLGMKNAKGNLFFLVNNDTVMTKDSLKNIVKTFESWNKKEKIGAINAKLVLIDKYLPVIIEEAFFSDYKVLDKEAESFNKEAFVLPHETSDYFSDTVAIPINYMFKRDLEINISIKPYKKNDFKLKLGKKVVISDKFRKLGIEKSVKIKIDKDTLKKNEVNLIQNAGNYYFKDGYGRDRGAVVYKHKQYYEVDKNQYNQEEFIEGFCGAGVLLNKKALKDVGYFDSNFFMYYEDGDLSFRLRENGWKVLFCPTAEIRHIHSGSSGEWPSFFIFNVERGRLLFIAKHWPRLLAIKEWLKFLFKDTLLIPVYLLFKRKEGKALQRFNIRVKVNFSLFPEFMLALLKIKRLSMKDIKSFA